MAADSELTDAGAIQEVQDNIEKLVSDAIKKKYIKGAEKVCTAELIPAIMKFCQEKGLSSTMRDYMISKINSRLRIFKKKSINYSIMRQHVRELAASLQQHYELYKINIGRKERPSRIDKYDIDAYVSDYNPTSRG